jgi:hypothetical protein
MTQSAVRILRLIAMRFAQLELGYMSRARYGTDKAYTDTCFSLAQGYRSGLRLRDKIGCGVKTSFFKIYNFQDFEKNIN